MNPIQQILETFEKFRMSPTPNNEYELKGKYILAEKLEKMIGNDAPLSFVMLGFPFKSTNQRDKVIGNVPDLGERLTIDNFTEFDKQIKLVYAPGVEIVIVSDGYVFNDLLHLNDGIVEAYKEISIDMAKNAPIQFYDLNDFYNKRIRLSEKRTKVVEQFGISEAKLDAEILTNPDVNFLYRGMIHFMTEELQAHPFVSHSQLQKAAKKLTREMMFRNEAYSNLVREEFSSYVRLSMHPSMDNGNKYSFKLIPGENTRHSAWHSAILMDKCEYITIHKKDAEALGAELQYKDGQPYSYIKHTA